MFAIASPATRIFEIEGLVSKQSSTAGCTVVALRAATTAQWQMGKKNNPGQPRPCSHNLNATYKLTTSPHAWHLQNLGLLELEGEWGSESL